SDVGYRERAVRIDAAGSVGRRSSDSAIGRASRDRIGHELGGNVTYGQPAARKADRNGTGLPDRTRFRGRQRQSRAGVAAVGRFVALRVRSAWRARMRAARTLRASIVAGAVETVVAWKRAESIGRAGGGRSRTALGEIAGA